VRQQRDKLMKLDDRAGPSVRQQQWERRAALARLMNKMQIDVVDRNRKVVELVERCFLLAPIVTVAPVTN
jgi:Spy/CpxP family protein refolding chaperone